MTGVITNMPGSRRAIREWLSEARDANGTVDVVSRSSAVAVLCSTAAVLAYAYFAYVDYPQLALRIGTHEQILDGTAVAPYRYRILVPFLVQAVIKGLSSFQPYPRAFLLAYGLYDVIAFSLLVATLYLYVRLWFSRTQSLVGILFAAATMPIALRDHFFQPWSPLETVFFTLGLLLNHQRRYALLGAMIVLAAFNRETAIFVVAACFFAELRAGGAGEAEPRGRLHAWLYGSYGLLWLAVFVGLRWARGATTPAITVPELWAANTTFEYLVRALVNVALFGGAFWVFAFFGFRFAPGYVRRSAAAAPFYLASVALFGVWFEVRLLMPLYPILIPLGLSFLYRRGNV